MTSKLLALSIACLGCCWAQLLFLSHKPVFRSAVIKYAHPQLWCESFPLSIKYHAAHMHLEMKIQHGLSNSNFRQFPLCLCVHQIYSGECNVYVDAQLYTRKSGLSSFKCISSYNFSFWNFHLCYHKSLPFWSLYTYCQQSRSKQKPL